MMGATAGPAASAADDGETRKHFRNGTHRVRSPAQTLARVRPFLPVMGITRIAGIGGLDRVGIPVVMACRPNSRSIAVAQGKGLDPDAAKASAVMEAIETWHAETIESPLLLASFDELRFRHRVIDVARLPMPADSRFHEHERILWIEGDELLCGGSIYVPYELVHTDYTDPPPAGGGCFVADTNGLASGNHRLEAILHGLCEVIERDATTLWTLGTTDAQACRCVDPASVDDALCRTILDRIEATGFDLRIWETTTDIGVASFVCLLAGRDTDDADPEFGGGCHPHRGVALSRALTEAVQARATFIAGSRDDMGWDLYSDEARAVRAAACAGLLRMRPQRRFTEAPSLSADSVADDVGDVLSRLKAIGIDEVAVVDLTKPAFRIPVVRVVVPGLEGAHHDDAGGAVAGRRARAIMGDRA
jgi:YcaO-like protein with predicted kinase domain